MIRLVIAWLVFGAVFGLIAFRKRMGVVAALTPPGAARRPRARLQRDVLDVASG